MITSIEITDSKNIHKRQVQELEAFTNGKKYVFKPGVNIIVGKNGCGKTTLLDLIADFTLCNETMSSDVPSELLDLNMFGDDVFNETSNICDGIKIHCDYAGVVFKSKLEAKDKEDPLKNMDNFSLFLNTRSSSTGQKTIIGTQSLLQKMFSKQTNLQFPIKNLLKLSQSCNEHWRNKINQLLRYYQENQISISKKDFEYTVLLDEPDRNLDIYSLDEIYDILKFHKERTQVIAVIHNPVLIYKLSKIKDINIIEMTEGYLNKLKQMIETL